MCTGMLILFVILLCKYISLASDPDPVLDFCIPNTEPEFSASRCKNSSAATVKDFVFSGIKNPANLKKTGFVSTMVNSNAFPALNTLGMSLARQDFAVGGVNVPHYHPSATEISLVLEGRIYSGFVDTQNRVFSKVLEKGEVMVFPRGLIHFQMNVGDTPASIVGSLNSQNPGVVRIPSTAFGSEIEETVLEKAFGLSSKEIAKLRKKVSPHELSY